MKKIVAALTLALVFGAAHADELTDAIKAFEAKNYPQAMQTYSKLANAGNADAQFLLGEMYWYGEGTAADDAQAKAWFEKSAAAGNAKAKAALGVMAQRVARRAEIDFYVNAFDGGEMKAARAACVRPMFPPLSKTNAEIKATNAAVKAWNACYNGFIDKLAASTPAKAIPADLLALMNEQEATAALARADKAYAALAAEIQSTGKAVLAQNDAWVKSTEQFVAANNAKAKEYEYMYELRRKEDLVRMTGSAGSAGRYSPATESKMR